MPLLRNDERFLHRALGLAEAQAAFASPNPSVGCVIARGETVLGEGAHRFELRDHAEIAALKQAAELARDVRGTTAYVTLEPCSHHGRTGPCADALIAAGIARCVVATVDPNPQVRGEGLAKLKAAGVELILIEPASQLADAARRLNDAFAFAIQHSRPFVTLKAAISADGKLAPPPAARTTGQPFWLTGEAARADVQQLRHRSDAILTGIGTVLADDPVLTDRTGLPRRRPLLRVVLDSTLRIPLSSKLVGSAREDLLIIASESASRERARALTSRGIEVVVLPTSSNGADLAALLGNVLQNRGIQNVLTEAGSTLNGALLEGGLVDRLILYKSPQTLGPEGLPFAKGQPDPKIWEQALSKVATMAFPHKPSQDLRTAGYLHDPWQGVDHLPVSRELRSGHSPLSIPTTPS